MRIQPVLVQYESNFRRSVVDEKYTNTFSRESCWWFGLELLKLSLLTWGPVGPCFIRRLQQVLCYKDNSLP